MFLVTNIAPRLGEMRAHRVHLQPVPFGEIRVVIAEHNGEDQRHGGGECHRQLVFHAHGLVQLLVQPRRMELLPCGEVTDSPGRTVTRCLQMSDQWVLSP